MRHNYVFRGADLGETLEIGVVDGCVRIAVWCDHTMMAWVDLTLEEFKELTGLRYSRKIEEEIATDLAREIPVEAQIVPIRPSREGQHG